MSVRLVREMNSASFFVISITNSFPEPNIQTPDPGRTTEGTES
jgi:hypothetical protein